MRLHIARSLLLALMVVLSTVCMGGTGWAQIKPIDFSKPLALSTAIKAVVSGGEAAASCGSCQGASSCTDVSLGCTKRQTFDGSSYCYGSSGAQNCSFTYTNYDVIAHWNSTGNADCTGSATPYACCTGSGAGNCYSALNGTYSAETAKVGAKWWIDVTAAGEYYAAAMYKNGNTTDDIEPLEFRDSGLNRLCRFLVSGGKGMAQTTGGTNSAGVTMSNGTLYYIKLRAKRTGTECQAWVSTNGQSWSDAGTSSGGTWNADITTLMHSGRSSSVSAVIDDIRLNASDISW